MTFARVDLKNAGPTALGILVPLGAKTLVIVRPRALTWDLLPARWNGDVGQAPQFCQFTRDEAAAVARRLIQALDASVNMQTNPVQTFGDAAGTRVQVWMRTDEFVWIACRRSLGEMYRPVLFSTTEEAVREAEALSAYVFPAGNVAQEYYVNTQSFS